MFRNLIRTVVRFEWAGCYQSIPRPAIRRLASASRGVRTSRLVTISHLARRRRMRGFLVPTALFVVVGAAALAAAMAQMAASSRSAAVLYALNSQAFYAADAGLQRAMTSLYAGGETLSAVSAQCSTVNGASVNFTVPGLQGCSSQLGCSQRQSDDGLVHVYSLLSISQCGSGSFEVGRRLAMESYMQNR